MNIIKDVAQTHEVVVGVSSEPDDILNMFRQLSIENPNISVFSYGRRIGAITYYSGGDAALSPRFFYRLLLTVKQKKYWNNKIREIDPDVVITNSKILCWMSCLSEIKKRKSICFVRETVKGKRKSLINRKIFKFLDEYKTVVFLSEYDKKLEKLKKAKSEVVHNFISDNQFNRSLSRDDAIQQLDLPQKSFYLLYVGGVSEMKGFDLVVEAVLSMDETVGLIVAGNDFDQARVTKDKSEIHYANKWQTYIGQNDIYGQVFFVGRMKDMSACYAASDVLVFPMRSPHQSRPAFEAGYFKKPVIISDFDNVSEFVRNGENGFRVPPNNVQALSEKLKLLCDDPVLRQLLGQNNYLNTIENHSKEKSCKKIRSLIDE